MDLPLPLSVEPPLEAAPPPFEELLLESDELLPESPLEPPELGAALASPVLDWAPVEEGDSDFIAFFLDSDG